MIDSGELLTLAELAVALAGFSALVSVVARRRGEVDTTLDAYGLRTLVEVSLITAAFCVFPVGVAKFTISDEVLWRISSGVFLAVRSTAAFFAIRRYQRIANLETPAHAAVRRWFLFPLALLETAALVLVVTGFSPVSGSAVYFFAIYADLIVGGVLFVQVAQSTIESLAQ